MKSNDTTEAKIHTREHL